MKNILVVSYSFPPMETANSFRVASLVKELSKQKYDITVVTRRGKNQPAYQIYEGHKVYRVYDCLNLIKNFSSISNSNNKEILTQKIYAKIIKRTYNLLVKSIYWPDFAFMWIIPASRKIRQLIANDEYDAILSISIPFASHVAAYLALEVDKEMKWIVDMSDPFYLLEETPPNNTALYRRKNLKIEKLVYKRANRIVIPTQLLDTYRKGVFISTGDKVVGVETAITMPEIAEYPFPHKYFSKEQLNIVYSGTFYRGIRNPEVFLQVASALKISGIDIVFHIFGNLNDCVEIVGRYTNKENIRYHGHVSVVDVHSVTSNCDFVVNIDNNNNYQIPSKIVQYMYFCKPIINFVFRRDTMLKQMMSDYPSSLILDVKEPKSKLVEKLSDFIKREKDKKFEYSINRYTMPEVAKNYIL